MPDFLLVGTLFSGAETLLDRLGEHPQIHASPIRETNYFVARDLGTEGVLDTVLLRRPQENDDGTFQAADVARVTNRRDYQRCFQAPYKPGARRFGEASPAYLLYPGAARRIAERVPHCKIVAVLRDPVERLLAHHAAFEEQGREHLTLEEALEQEDRRLAAGWAYHWAYLGLSGYTAALGRYLARFPLPQVHLVRAEDLQDPERRPAAWRALLDFLAVDAGVPAPGKFELSPETTATAERTRRAVTARLRKETQFYQEVFAEMPFRRAVLRQLARESTGGQTDRTRLTDAGQAPDASEVFQHLLFTTDPIRGPLYHRKI